jgi:glutathione S-transferase
MSDLTMVGRSSSHFTRTARIFALELGVPHTFRPVLDMTSLDVTTYAGNPALKVPTLIDAEGPLFGTENICRELVRRSAQPARVVMRGDVRELVVANVEDLTLHVMSAEVALIMAKVAGDGRPAPPKIAPSIEGSLDYLDERVEALVAALPRDRTLSFVEVALYCVVTHLPFRQVMDVTPWARLGAFCGRFGERESAKLTEYCFDRSSAQT